jgi:hypothetical protein
MTPAQEQIIADVRALIAALPSPAAIAESQSAVALLTADLAVAAAEIARFKEIAIKDNAAAYGIVIDNKRLTRELEAVKELLSEPAP